LILGVILFIIVGCLNLPIIFIGLVLFGAYIAYLWLVLGKGKVPPPNQGFERNRIASVDSADGVYVAPSVQGNAKQPRKSRLESGFEAESVTSSNIVAIR
jgi:hypothetical protein